MKLKDHSTDSIVTLELGGKVMVCDELTAFRGKIQYYLDLNRRSFVVDLEHVDWMSSAGLGALVSAYSSVQKVGGRFALANITNIQNLLNVTQLARVFDSYDSRSDALRAVTSHL